MTPTRFLSMTTIPDTDIHAFIESCQRRTEAALEHWLPPADVHPAQLHAAMRYAVLGGGKRIRPTLAYASGAAVGVRQNVIDAPACAVELIHAYSLVHDDLPAMDNDDLRRNKPSCHKAYGEAIAILVGDALQSLAFRILARESDQAINAETRTRLVDVLALAAGSRGMAGGQAIDLAAVGQELNLGELEDMHIHKTGALIRASVMLGALCQPDLEQSRLDHLDHYAKCMGLAFQIRDDILDIEGKTSRLGKLTGVDKALQKPTYPGLLGLDGAKQRATELREEAIETLAEFGPSADHLRGLAHRIVSRDH
jgi:geranylgeranyl pyrophosphate synthase